LGEEYFLIKFCQENFARFFKKIVKRGLGDGAINGHSRKDLPGKWLDA
jgi:hypothetical protein